MPERLAFVVTEDRFFASHFLPMARAARESGLEVTVITRVREHRAPIEAAGARVIPLNVERGSLNPLSLGTAARRLARIFSTEQIDIVHCISLRGILTGGLAARLAGIERRIFAVTGFGVIGAAGGFAARLGRRALTGTIRGGLVSADTRFLFENGDDARRLGLSPGDPRVTIVAGAGVDPGAFPMTALPPLPPIRAAMVSRMLWSKGPDLAVEGVRLARAHGTDVTLSLYGAPDPSNPRAVAEDTLAAWGREEGIAWHGPTGDVAAVWADHHLCLLPSRGGEGLPRSLLEAASSGRALVTTDVPGCRDFVRNGCEGLVVGLGSADAIADALAALARQPDRLVAMGQAARMRLFEGSTEAQVIARLVDLYRSLRA